MENAIKAYDTYRNLLYAEGGLPENVRHDLNIDDLCERVDYTSSIRYRKAIFVSFTLYR